MVDLIRALEEAWKSVREMQISNVELEAVPSCVYMDKPTDSVIHLVIEVKSEGCKDLTRSLCYLLSSLEPVLPDLK